MSALPDEFCLEAYFEVAELCELLAALIETTKVGPRLIVDDLMGADIPALSESLPTDFALVWAFSGMPSFVRLKAFISQDRRRLSITHTFKFPSWEKLRPHPGSLHG
jgi:hypothetical protein